MIDAMMLERYSQGETERMGRMKRAWEAYEGNFPASLKSSRTDRGGQDNVRFNFAKLIVNKSVGSLFGSKCHFGIENEEETEAEEWLEACWKANQKMSTLIKAGINGGVTGHVFLKIQTADPARNEHPFPTVTIWDPQCVRVTWDPRDHNRVMSYSYTWNAVDADKMQAVVYRQHIERNGAEWIISDQKSTAGGSVWVDEFDPTPWPYTWAPVFQCQNLLLPNCFWGLADLEADILGLNENANSIGSTTNRTLRNNAFPQVWGKGFQAKEIERSIDSLIVLPSKDAELQLLEMSADGLEAADRWYARIREALHEQSRIPEVATGKLESLGGLSGTALRILYGPLIELTEVKRISYGEMLQQLCRRLLELGGHPDKSIEIEWPSITPTDPKGDAETAILQQQAGVSKETTIQNLGFDAEAETKKRATEAESDVNVGNALLDRFNKDGGQGGGVGE